MVFFFEKTHGNFIIDGEEIILYEENLLIINTGKESDVGIFQSEIRYNYDLENEEYVTLKGIYINPFSKTLVNDVKKILLLV